MNKQTCIMKLKIRKQMNQMMLDRGKGLSDLSRAYHTAFDEHIQWVIDQFENDNMDKLDFNEQQFYQTYMQVQNVQNLQEN